MTGSLFGNLDRLTGPMVRPQPIPFQPHSATSRAAAEAKDPSTDEAAVERFIRDRATYGATDDEGLAAGIVGPNSYRARRVALVERRVIVARYDAAGVPVLRKTRTGRAAQVYTHADFDGSRRP
jgi:hypothetical protein